MRASLTNNPPTLLFAVDMFGNPTVKYPPLWAHGGGKGIYSVAEIIQHEQQHLATYNEFGMPDKSTDWDEDGIPSADEATYMGIATDPMNCDTYNVWGGGINNICPYGDDDIRCRIAETNRTITVYPERDWANPGMQHKNQYGEPRIEWRQHYEKVSYCLNVYGVFLHSTWSVRN